MWSIKTEKIGGSEFKSQFRSKLDWTAKQQSVFLSLFGQRVGNTFLGNKI